MIKIISFTLGAMSLLFLATASGAAQESKPVAATFQFGNQVVTIPAPEGFEDAAAQFEKIRNHFTATESPGNTMLAVHLPSSECRKLGRGEVAPFTFYTKVTVAKTARESDFSAAQFASLVADLQKTAATLLDANSASIKQSEAHLGKSLSELNKEKVQVDFGQPVHLGVFDNRPNAYSFMVLVNLKVQSGNDEVVTAMLGGLSFIRVRQRLVFVYTYRRYESKADVETLREFTKQWIGQILAAN